MKAQTLNLLGPSPASQWGALVWGVGSWGQKVAGSAGIIPLIKSVGVVWSKSNTYSATDTPPLVTFTRVWTGTNKITFSDMIIDVEVTQGIYNEMFIDGVHNFISGAARSVYALIASAPATYTTLAAASTLWN